MVQIKQVAERAGVSSATVSRVLSGSSPVTPENRDRVLRAVADLGYRPNRLARNLRRRTTETIGVVVSDIENPHFTSMVREVEDAVYRRGFRVLLCNTDERASKQRDYLEVLIAERVIGVILVPTDPAGPEIGHLLDTGIPLVAFDRAVADPRADAVVIDNVETGRRATEHLLQAGHQRVGFVGGLATMQTGAERQAGYEAALEARGLSPCSVDGAFRIDRAEQATAALLADGEAITALVVANNLMTIGALRAVRARRLRVPEDLALVAIDDPPWAELVDPPLTAMAQPVRRMAETAVALLFERIGGARGQTKHVVLDSELRVRRSCAAAPPALRSGLPPSANRVPER